MAERSGERTVYHKGYKFTVGAKFLRMAYLWRKSVFINTNGSKLPPDANFEGVLDALLKKKFDSGEAEPALTLGPETGVGQFGNTILTPTSNINQGA